MTFASGYFKTRYADELGWLDTRARKVAFFLFLVAVLIFPGFASPFGLDLANQVFLSLIGAVALMLLTGFAGQISLGHAGLLAAGAFTTAILFKEAQAPIWITLPASGLVGAVLGIIFGFPSLRLKGLYLALSTMALHFIVIYGGSEYQTRRGFATGVVLDPPKIGSWIIEDPRVWYFILLGADIIVMLFALNMIRSKTGRAWIAIRDRDVAAEALGVNVPFYKVSSFMISSTITCMAGSLFSYYRGFVSVEAFTLLTTIEYVAIIIIGGIGSMLGVVFGTIFIVLLPYGIDTAAAAFAIPTRLTTYLSSIKYAAFGLIMIIFLLLEPNGLVGIWHRVRDYFLLWPFKHKPVGR
jgi:branched-chain amino acid transport system permease protein